MGGALMATTVIRFDTSDVQKTMRAYRTRFPKAVRRALKRAATTARAQLARDVAADMKLKVGVVKDALTIREEGDDTIALRAPVKRVPLYDFLPGSGDPRGPYPSKGQRQLRVRGKTYPGAFIAQMGSGHWGVFIRRGYQGRGMAGPSASARKSVGAWSPNLPIKELRRASIWQSAVNHVSAAQASGLAALQKNLASELHFAANVEGK